MKIRFWLLCILSWILAALGAFTMLVPHLPQITKIQSKDLSFQIIQLETPRNVDSVLDLLRFAPESEPDKRQVFVDECRLYLKSIQFDYYFLLLYPLQLIALCGFVWLYADSSLSKTLLWIGVCSVVSAAFCDWHENEHMVTLIDSIRHSIPSQAMVDSTRTWSLAKWTLLGIAWLSVAWPLHRKIEHPPHRSRPEMPPMGPWRLRAIIVTLTASGVASLWGVLSFFPFVSRAVGQDFRPVFSLAVFMPAIAVLACALVRPWLTHNTEELPIPKMPRPKVASADGNS